MYRTVPTQVEVLGSLEETREMELYSGGDEIQIQVTLSPISTLYLGSTYLFMCEIGTYLGRYGT